MEVVEEIEYEGLPPNAGLGVRHNFTNMESQKGQKRTNNNLPVL